ncbi:uncharacterized protein AFUA_8G07290 [Aspergillus fumigatus Af293]|uniref:Uncharacterized protein n=2 Tax=Aspergillus fumigatus TaxID=746128 RepID=Q4WBP2_ASPFU|nr:hypothetical protein AFUA_8G07290 [Aspergillus fumigatus Af293]EAL85492.1 hypothetical protein AFUA_8G07290 [Aspergillus fumigatus Af293]EDP48610.1 hypothetical protein AFUB_080450 [Aspergillus fumigatus A1163]
MSYWRHKKRLVSLSASHHPQTRRGPVARRMPAPGHGSRVALSTSMDYRFLGAVAHFGEERDVPEIDRLQLRQLPLDSMDARSDGTMK